ncbi:oxidoreductase-like domain-containing protein [Pseudoxanthomonas mexicana]|uniref:oxidoreductase-like domain-containing protein n=1 Tax=Pseudoxanthomonas mexicana TaxID=128785 RepID=UPI0022F3EE2D|nr:oxidoreductase-like domain-containing protein [Pseudoxanthomonas mexicana]WBX94986.1 oxidoreductase-like domain-containing protein [Pseudoxanthomonas mexicana]
MRPDDDPRPVEPEPPLHSDCCNSGCPICVHDLYAEQLQHYREQLAAWNVRNPISLDFDTHKSGLEDP